MYINKKRYLNKLFDDLLDFFNPEFLDRTWVKAIGPEVSSYGEAMCMLFDDDMLDFFVDEYIYEIIEKSDPIIKEFRKLRDMLQDFNPPREMRGRYVVEQPEWKAIMAQAAKVLELSRNSPLAEYMPKK